MCIYDMAAEVEPAADSERVMIFTDPVISGKYGKYSISGDSDDLAAAAALAGE